MKVTDPDTGEIVDATKQRPMNPQEVSEALQTMAILNAALDEGLVELKQLSDVLVDAEDAFEEARAKKVVELVELNVGKPRAEQSTVDERKARSMADPVVREKHRAFLDARQAVRVQKDRMHTWRSQLSAYQTVTNHIGGRT